MNDDRQFCCARKFHLPNEDVFLDLTRRMIVVLVEANLSPRDYFRFARELFKLCEIRACRQACLVWMNADRSKDEVVLFADFYGAVERTRSVARAYRKNVGDSSFARASDHLLAVGVKAGTIKMAMGIDEH